MTGKKYELFRSEARALGGRTLFRIRALQDIPKHGVKAGDLGGFIESETNLSHDFDAWVDGNASVYGNSTIIREVLVTGNAKVFNSRLWGNTIIGGHASITGSRIHGKSLHIQGKAIIENVDLVISEGLIQGEVCLMNVFGRNPLQEFVLSESASIIGSSDKHLLMGGSDILVSGNAMVKYAECILGDGIEITDHAVLEKGAGIKGQDIHLLNHAVVTGMVYLADGASVSEFAKVYAGKGTMKITSERFNGDVEINMRKPLKVV